MACVSVLAAACSHPPAHADLHAIPEQNVLLITIDTLRADALGSYGGRASTPALDRLAAEGVRFDFAHAHAVITLASHATILTGEYPFTHGLRDNSGFRLPATARTAATLLKAAGYATGAFVAAFPLHSRFGLNAGFDVYDDHFGETRAPTEFVMPERPASAVVPLARAWIASRDSSLASRGSHLASRGSLLASRGSSLASRSASNQQPATSSQQPPPSGEQRAASDELHPWFCWVHLFDPHAPYQPSYEGEVEKVDAALAPLLDEVRAAAKPTIVIVTGDHGEALGEHGEQSHGLFAYESTLHVPLIITELGGNRPSPAGGEVSSVGARHIDLLPTMLDAVGQAVPADLPGRTLLPSSERAASAPPRPSYFEAMSGMLNRGSAPLTGVLVGREKFIDLPLAERYDLAADRTEVTNLFGRAADRDRTLQAVLRGYGAPLPDARLTEAPDVVERLRALGYASGDAPARQKYTEADDPKRLADLDAAIHRAVEAFGAGRAGEAIQIYQQVLARRPDMGIASRHLAFVQWQSGDASGAIATLKRATGAGATDPRVLTQLGGYLTDSGQVAEAIRILEPIVTDATTDPDTLNSLGIAYAQSGRVDQARRAFLRVLAANPGSSVPLENLGMLALGQGDLAAAKQRFESAVEANPRSSRAYSGVGLVALRRGDRKTAIEAWTKAVQLDPSNIDALYNLGTTLARDGQADRARPYLEQFLRTAPARYDNDKREVARLLQR